MASDQVIMIDLNHILASEDEGESSGYSEEAIAFNKILTKRQKVKEEDEEDKNSLDSDDELVGEFELVAPCESFFHSIKMLIHLLCDDQKYDVSGLADALIAQQSLGSLPVTTLDFDLEEKYGNLKDAEFEKMRIKFNNDRDVYGITTVINFSKRENKQCLEDIYGYIMYNAKKNLDKQSLKKFISILNSKKIGLLINERYLNLPVSLIPDMLRGIVKDIDFTKQQDDVEDPSDYDFDYFLGIGKLTPADLYYKSEEERFIKDSEIQFKFI
jgi:protein BCP1